MVREIRVDIPEDTVPFLSVVLRAEVSDKVDASLCSGPFGNSSRKTLNKTCAIFPVVKGGIMGSVDIFRLLSFPSGARAVRDA